MDNGTKVTETNRIADTTIDPKLLTVLQITRRVHELQMALREAVQMLQVAEAAYAKQRENDTAVTGGT